MMTLKKTAEALREDLLAVARLEGGEGRERAVRILDGLVPARLTAFVAEVAEEVSRVLPTGRVEVRLSGSDVEVVYMDEPALLPTVDEEESSARITVRLGGSLKEAVETAAIDEGVSVNAFVVGALMTATHRHGRRHDRRIRGYGRA
jgi:hypothetical protein